MSLNTLHDQLDNIQDYNGKKLLGRVVNNQDPDGMNRFQVKIPGLYEDGELPWVGMSRSSPFGSGPGFGTYGAPAIGALAIIELQGGDSHKPMCTGFSQQQTDKNPAFAAGTTWGYADPNGTKLVVDTVAKTYTFTHVSGTTYTIDASGNLTAHTAGNVNITVTGNINITSTGTTTVKASAATINAPTTTCTGSLIVEGLLRVLAGMQVTGDIGDGHSATFTGNVNHTAGTFTSNNVSISGHEHPYDDGETGSPTPGT